MMHSLTRKVRTARRVYAEAGLRGAKAALLDKRPWLWLRRSYWTGWLDRNHVLLGRLIELTGNRVRVEGCHFDLEHPAIPTWRKSLFLFNRYEIEERRALAQVLDRDLPVVEFGGSIGVVACITNRRLRHPERHVVVEANSDLIPLLEKNRARNNARFTVLHRAVAYAAGEVPFQHCDFLSGRVQGSGGRAVRVPTVSLREIVDGFGFERCTLICDIEGEEIELVRHEQDVLRDRVATLVIEAHPGVTGAEAAGEMLRALEDLSFVPVFREQETWAFRNMRLASGTAMPVPPVN